MYENRVEIPSDPLPMQGNRILCGEHFAEIVLTPTSFEALGFGAALGGAFVLEQIQGHMP